MLRERWRDDGAPLTTSARDAHDAARSFALTTHRASPAIAGSTSLCNGLRRPSRSKSTVRWRRSWSNPQPTLAPVTEASEVQRQSSHSDTAAPRRPVIAVRVGPRGREDASGDVGIPFAARRRSVTGFRHEVASCPDFAGATPVGCQPLSARGDGESRVLAPRGLTGALVEAAFTGDCCAAGAGAGRRACAADVAPSTLHTRAAAGHSGRLVCRCDCCAEGSRGRQMLVVAICAGHVCTTRSVLVMASAGSAPICSLVVRR